jgi:Na+/proline symporter
MWDVHRGVVMAVAVVAVVVVVMVVVVHVSEALVAKPINVKTQEAKQISTHLSDSAMARAHVGSATQAMDARRMPECLPLSIE